MGGKATEYNYSTTAIETTYKVNFEAGINLWTAAKSGIIAVNKIPNIEVFICSVT
jgi:hypothetical protein